MARRAQLHSSSSSTPSRLFSSFLMDSSGSTLVPLTPSSSSAGQQQQLLVTVHHHRHQHHRQHQQQQRAGSSGEDRSAFLSSSEREDIAQSIIMAWRALMSLPEPQSSSVALPSSLPRPETPQQLPVHAEEEQEEESSDNEEEEDEQQPQQSSFSHRAQVMEQLREAMQQLPSPPDSFVATLIVYIYWRGVQSWDNESVRQGNWPSEMISWHVKGLEYDLRLASAQEASAAASFEMTQEQVRELMRMTMVELSFIHQHKRRWSTCPSACARWTPAACASACTRGTRGATGASWSC